MSDKKKCFIIMPFGEEGTDEHLRNLKIYQNIIKPIAEECGYIARRADELEYLGNITHDIIEWLYQSDLVIADLSGRNPNVFYELGVRHALLRAGTIPIMRKGEKPPFDIAHYRTVFYSIELDGPENLKTQLRKRILAFENEQGHRCDNPVHEVLGDKIFQNDAIQQELVAKNNALQELENEARNLQRLLDQKRNNEQIQEKQLKTLQQENAKIQSTYQTRLAEYQKLTAQARQWAQEKQHFEQQIAGLENELQARNQKIKLRETPPKLPPSAKPRFRSEKKPLSDDEVKKMLAENNFFASDWNHKGAGFKHDYQEQELNGAKIIWDKASGLMWQQGGSPDSLVLKEAEDYIKKLNQEKFAGFNDWRLPTLEEAMSLMESKKNKADLYLDARFDANQRYIWTDDQRTGGSDRWVVGFLNGYCLSWDHFGYYYFVRAVRLGQSSTG